MIRPTHASRVAAIAAGGIALLIATACGGGGSQPTPEPAQLGDPIAGLSADELAAFEAGKLVFERRFKPSEGLGPLYNATSCVSCHSSPVTGGSSKLYRNFYVARSGDPTVPGGQSDLAGLPSLVIPAFGSGPHATTTFTLQGGRRLIPHDGLNGGSGDPVQVAQRNAIPIFGVGLFQSVTNATIMSNADPEDADADGISGRFNVVNGIVGRFGVKAQAESIEAFTRPPLQNQMGITTNAFIANAKIREQGTIGTNTPTTDNDGVPDPELSNADLGSLIVFTLFLGPPRKKPFNAAATRGEEVFDALGCVKCHIPSLPSSRGPVDAYTDLLLHDMGSDLADHIAMGTPQASTIDGPTTDTEFRTQPLWGVSLHGPWLHDGRAGSLMEAILLHGGEAQAIRDAFDALTAGEKADVIAFLEHL